MAIILLKLGHKTVFFFLISVFHLSNKRMCCTCFQKYIFSIYMNYCLNEQESKQKQIFLLNINFRSIFFIILSNCNRKSANETSLTITLCYCMSLTYLQCSSPILPLSSMSTRRPGVATRRWQPRSRSRIWAPMSAPPYTTQGLTRDR